MAKTKAISTKKKVELRADKLFNTSTKTQTQKSLLWRENSAFPANASNVDVKASYQSLAYQQPTLSLAARKRLLYVAILIV